MNFVDEILNYSSLSIVGLEKNTGKTECLKYVLENLPLAQKRVAVTSIGIDGESVDQVTQTQKPEIVLREGMFFGTSETHYRQRKLLSELIDVSDVNTSLGRVVTAKALTRGKILLSGPSTGASLRRWMREMQRYGIDLVIVDGALSRMSSASPAVSESMILSTGAAFSANLQTLVQKTAYVVELINLELTSPENLALLNPIEKGVWAIDGEGHLHDLKVQTSLVKELQLDGVENCRTLYVAGALVDGFIEKLRQNKKLKGVELVVRDFTKVFASEPVLRPFLRSGGRLKVLQKSKLIAVTVNPTSPSGYVLDSDVLCRTLADTIHIPVYDILKNKACN
ncbi:MAG: hypothetical protein HUK16_05995 [Bacteroidales bacterium]|nr:hypothetical protein [Bacteroidales bacterium]